MAESKDNSTAVSLGCIQVGDLVFLWVAKWVETMAVWRGGWLVARMVDSSAQWRDKWTGGKLADKWAGSMVYSRAVWMDEQSV